MNVRCLNGQSTLYGWVGVSHRKVPQRMNDELLWRAVCLCGVNGNKNTSLGGLTRFRFGWVARSILLCFVVCVGWSCVALPLPSAARFCIVARCGYRYVVWRSHRRTPSYISYSKRCAELRLQDESHLCLQVSIGIRRWIKRTTRIWWFMSSPLFQIWADSSMGLPWNTSLCFNFQSTLPFN